MHVIACVWLQPTAKVAYDLLTTASASQPAAGLGRREPGWEGWEDAARARPRGGPSGTPAGAQSAKSSAGLSPSQSDHARAVRLAQAAAARASAPPPLRLTAELLAPDEIFAGMLVQVASDTRLQDVFAAFTTHVQGAAEAPPDGLPWQALGGVRVALRQPGAYGIRTWGGTAFRTVAELARKRRETAIGLLMRDGELELAPAADSERELCGGDRIVVLCS